MGVRKFLVTALAILGCSSGGSVGPTGDLPIDVRVEDAQISIEGETKLLTIEATLINRGNDAIAIMPECGGTFGLELWDGDEWVRYESLADCIPQSAVMIEPNDELAATRVFGTNEGTYRIVVREHSSAGNRLARSASFEVVE